MRQCWHPSAGMMGHDAFEDVSVEEIAMGLLENSVSHEGAGAGDYVCRDGTSSDNLVRVTAGI